MEVVQVEVRGLTELRNQMCCMGTVPPSHSSETLKTHVIVPKRLRDLTRNQVRSRAQVRILPMTVFSCESEL